MRKGKVILIPFPFTDLSGHKVRPAVVLHNNIRGDDCIVCFISSKQNERIGSFDIKVNANADNGLKVNSVIKTSKIATLEKKIALGEIGTLDKNTIKEIDRKLKSIFSL